MVKEILNPQTLPQRIFRPLDIAFDNIAKIASSLSFIVGKHPLSFAYKQTPANLKALITPSFQKMESMGRKVETWSQREPIKTPFLNALDKSSIQMARRAYLYAHTMTGCISIPQQFADRVCAFSMESFGENQAVLLTKLREKTLQFFSTSRQGRFSLKERIIAQVLKDHGPSFLHSGFVWGFRLFSVDLLRRALQWPLVTPTSYIPIFGGFISSSLSLAATSIALTTLYFWTQSQAKKEFSPLSGAHLGAFKSTQILIQDEKNQLADELSAIVKTELKIRNTGNFQTQIRNITIQHLN